MNECFTFAIISYNQQDFILETLESIKYQILHYGSDIRCSLIVGDDHSLDDTIVLIRRWLETNHSLFVRSDIIERDANVGLNRNYLDVLDKIQDEHYKIIAGDDLFSCECVFEWGPEDSINAYYPIILCKGVLSIDEEILNRVLYFAGIQHCNIDDRFRVALGDYMNTPSVFVNKTLMTKTVQDTVSQYRNFEDDPGWYAILKSNPAVTTQFFPKCKVIYRIHEQSLSHGLSSEKNRMFFEDLLRFRLECAKNMPGLHRKIAVFGAYFYLKMMDIGRRTIYISPFYYFEKYKRRHYRKASMRRSNYAMERKRIEAELEHNTIYYREIRSSAEQFKAAHIR